eukprot:1507480-Rhodomonas_salina.1
MSRTDISYHLLPSDGSRYAISGTSLRAATPCPVLTQRSASPAHAYCPSASAVPRYSHAYCPRPSSTVLAQYNCTRMAYYPRVRRFPLPY